MTKRAADWFGAILGGIVGLLLVIAYNTSASVSLLEGGHGHLTFGVAVVAAIGGAGLGAVTARRSLLSDEDDDPSTHELRHP